MSEELKPCFMPDCGSTLVGTSRLPCGVNTVSCGHCGVSVPDTDEATAIERWNRRAPLPAEQPSKSVALTDMDILDDETLQYHFGLNGGAGPVSKTGWKIINAVARIVGQQTKGGGNGA